MTYLLFFLNYFFAVLSFSLLLNRDWIEGCLFSLMYCITYWIATKREDLK